MAAGGLREALADSQRLGMLGSRPIDEVIEHAQAFVDALSDVTGTVLDLGSGGGVPGLVIAVARPDLRVLLVDRRTARTDHLARLVRRLELDDRVEVIAADASILRLPTPVDAVVARGFGPPVSTGRIAVAFLRPHGRFVVSEPPGDAPRRWGEDLVRRMHLVRLPHGDPRVAVFAHVPRGT